MPTNPALHSHLKLPIVFSHSAFLSQGFIEHSFMSENEMKWNRISNNLKWFNVYTTLYVAWQLHMQTICFVMVTIEILAVYGLWYLFSTDECLFFYKHSKLPNKRNRVSCHLCELWVSFLSIFEKIDRIIIRLFHCQYHDPSGPIWCGTDNVITGTHSSKCDYYNFSIYRGQM